MRQGTKRDTDNTRRGLDAEYTQTSMSERKRHATTSSVLLVGDLAHFAETLARTGKTVFELEDFDLFGGYT